jgi:hypothetical protein
MAPPELLNLESKSAPITAADMSDVGLICENVKNVLIKNLCVIINS